MYSPVSTLTSDVLEDSKGKYSGLLEGRVHTVALLTVGLVLRLFVLCVVLAQHTSGWIYSHGIEMGLLAKSLLEGRGLGSPFGGSTGPTAYFAPAYPLFVAAVFRVCGSYSVASEIVIVGSQILMNEITIWLILVVTQKLFGARSANIAGVLWACSLPLIWLPTVFWETCLSTCVLAGVFPLALRCLRESSKLVWIGAGAYCGFAALVNPALLPSCLAMFAWAAYGNRKKAIAIPAYGLIAALLVLCPWIVRNERAFHAFVPTRSNMGYELWMGNHPGASGYLEEATFPLFDKHELERYKAMGEIAYSADKMNLAKAYMHAHPIPTVLLSAKRFVRFWCGTGNRGGPLVYPIHALTTTVFGLLGLWLTFHYRDRVVGLLLLLPLVIFPWPYYVTHAEFRFRIVIDPLLTILSGYAISEILRRFQRVSLPSTPLRNSLCRPWTMVVEMIASPELVTPDRGLAEDRLSPSWLDRRTHLPFITSVAFALRFLLLAALAAQAPVSWFFLQATELAALAQSLLAHHGLASPFGGSTGPSAFLAPGYPFLVAIVFHFFGDSTRTAAVTLVAIQSFFNVGTVAALALIARGVFGHRVANIAGLFWAISPPLLWIPMIFWETSFTLFALTGMVALFLWCASRPTLIRWFAIGAGCGVALLVNPSLALAFFAGGVWTAYRTHRSGLVGPAIGLLAFTLIFSPWPVRNFRTMHALILFRTNLGYELWQGNRVGANGFFSPSLHPNVNVAQFKQYAALGELEYMHEKTTIAIDTIGRNPARFVALTIKRAGWFWTGLGGFMTASPILIGHILLTTLLGGTGLVLMFRGKHSATPLFALVLVLFPLPYYVTHPDPRFRLVLDPLLTVLAAYAITFITQRRRVSL